MIGRVGRPHGVRGEVTVQPLTDEPARRFVPGVVLAAGDRTLTLAGARRHGDRLLAVFEEIADREAAADLTGTLLSLDVPADEDTGEDDAWYDHQLVGLTVRSTSGVDLGEVLRVEHGAQDLLVVRVGAGERLVPFVGPIVPVVDVAAGFLVVDPPSGLLDDAD